MKSTFLFCIILTAAGGALQLFLSTIGNARIAAFLNRLLGIIILITLVGGLSGISTPQLNINAYGLQNEYDALQEKTMREVIQIAEKDVSKKILEEFENVFKYSPEICNVSIDKETLQISNITVFFSMENTFISAYNVKQYIQKTYNAKAEVVFFE